MPLLSARLLVPVAVVVLAWGGIHLLTSHNLAVIPAVWPAAASTPSSVPRGCGRSGAIPSGRSLVLAVTRQPRGHTHPSRGTAAAQREYA